MAINYHQPSVIGLFDAMPVPLLTFGVSGKVTFANRAARLHPGQPVESMDEKPDIKALVGDAVLGRIKLPHPMDIELAGGHRMKGQFMPGPAGLDVAFIALDGNGNSPSSGDQAGQMGFRDTIGFLRAEVGPPMKQFILELRDQPATESSKTLESAAKALHERLSRLADLIEVFGEEVAFSNDRLEVAPLMRMLCKELAPRAQASRVNFQIVEPAQTLPPIYGSEKLIRRAFYECLENALQHSRKEVAQHETTTIEIRFKMTGTHVLLGIHNQGATKIKVSSAEALKPFAATPAKTPTRLGLPLIQRIVAMHGGSMRMSTTGDDSVNVLLEFPTGAPQRGHNQLDAAQAQRYANDFAQLMSRRKKEKK
ncbi:MAG: hypothetical protein Q8K22_01800 [Rhodoferax sp.]|nr:hypothetical protein [Rhodoferax sp.]